jgi:cobalamin biosynthesis protein CobD/CbiB
LGGPSSYGGVVRDKPWIGGAGRAVRAADIAAAGRLMSATAWLALVLVLAARLGIWGVVAAHATP